MFDRLAQNRHGYLTQLGDALPAYVETGHVPTLEVARLAAKADK
jgi:hypothetical protein